MGRLLALTLTVATVLLIAIATLWPDQSTMAMMAGTRESSLRRSSSPQAAAEIFLGDITRRDWDGAYARLANKSEFTLDEFERDLTGGYPSLRSQANLGG